MPDAHDRPGSKGPGPAEPFHTAEKPPHVPIELVVDFDFLAPLPKGEDHYTVLKRLQDRGRDILWTPRNGGHWIVTRAEDIKWVQENYDIFSHEVFLIPRGSVKVRMPPLTVDPPNHARYRAVFNPFFTPSKIAEISTAARARAVELIGKIVAQKRCEFVSEFAHVLPVDMFLHLVDLPLARREEFITWGANFQRARDQETKDRWLAPILAYLKSMIEERYRNPGKDMLSAFAKWRDHPRFGGEHEVIGMALLIYLAGLDTVASLLSFVVRHLAKSPAHRRRLMDEPEILPRAMEEYFRRFGLSNTGRLIVQDVERKGATMKADEMIMVPIGCSSIDERVYADPFTIDFDRTENYIDGRPAHNTFGNGPHKCVGMPLARAELQIFLEEWLKRVPEFRLDPAQDIAVTMGSVPVIYRLHLILA